MPAFWWPSFTNPGVGKPLLVQAGKRTNRHSLLELNGPTAVVGVTIDIGHSSDMRFRGIKHTGCTRSRSILQANVSPKPLIAELFASTTNRRSLKRTAYPIAGSFNGLIVEQCRTPAPIWIALRQILRQLQSAHDEMDARYDQHVRRFALGRPQPRAHPETGHLLACAVEHRHRLDVRARPRSDP